MSHKVFRCLASLSIALAFCFAGFTPALAAPPSNDNFADALTISALPFTDTTDTGEATLEGGHGSNRRRADQESTRCSESGQ